MYTCEVTLTVDGVDNFTSTSNFATVGLRGTYHRVYVCVCVRVETIQTSMQIYQYLSSVVS